ncbi:6-hydroxymethylpterin diphosphokinase MptE-like protein [Catenovulum sediminis]|uniref:6-hydroxymethylpterin diphosphokinase MptE-like protein n=1 Tax=Catenovulum sediminis TaxID=1740262 RepID=A0ABV1RKQ9_9ALTE
MDIKKHKNKYLGQDVYILANGPSVYSHDLQKLKGCNVIGMNASSILEHEFGFNSQYYCVSDLRFYNNEEKRKYCTELLSPQTVKVFRSEIAELVSPLDRDDTCYIKALSRDGFSTDISQGFYFGCTTTMLALQLAYYLGAKKIYLLGVDLRYSNDAPRFYVEKSVQHEDPYTSVQIKNIVEAARFLESKNVSVVNCSEFSFLRLYLPYEKFGI